MNPEDITAEFLLELKTKNVPTYLLYKKLYWEYINLKRIEERKKIACERVKDQRARKRLSGICYFCDQKARFEKVTCEACKRKFRGKKRCDV